MQQLKQACDVLSGEYHIHCITITLYDIPGTIATSAELIMTSCVPPS